MCFFADVTFNSLSINAQFFNDKSSIFGITRGAVRCQRAECPTSGPTTTKRIWPQWSKKGPGRSRQGYFHNWHLTFLGLISDPPDLTSNSWALLKFWSSLASVVGYGEQDIKKIKLFTTWFHQFPIPNFLNFLIGLRQCIQSLDRSEKFEIRSSELVKQCGAVINLKAAKIHKFWQFFDDFWMIWI